MTLFEIIILISLYLFCYVFSILILMDEEDRKLTKVLLLFLMLILSPFITITALAAYVAAVIRIYFRE